jgi:hypothetical protein
LLTVPALAAALLVVQASPAAATYDPIGSGAVRLNLAPGFLALLKQNGVRLGAQAGASIHGRTVAFPVAEGKFDPTTGQGTVGAEGTLVLARGKRSIPVKALQLKTTRKSAPLSVKLGGSQLKLASARSLEARREGFDEGVAIGGLGLNAKVATRLGKKLGLRGVFKAGQPLGTAAAKLEPATIAVTQANRAVLTLDPGFVAKLNSLFVAVNPVFPAEHEGSVFSLPLFGGTIAVAADGGSVSTQGSLEFLQLGGGQVFWANPLFDLSGAALTAEVDTQPSPPYGGKIGPAAVSSLVVSSSQANPKARTVSVATGSLQISSATAASFNEVFAKPQGRDNVFASGESLGSLTFVAQGQ